VRSGRVTLSKQSVTLTVDEAYRSDRQGVKIVRIDPSKMEEIGVSTGDFVRIKRARGLKRSQSFGPSGVMTWVQTR